MLTSMCCKAFYNYVEERQIGTKFNSTKNFEERINILF